MQKLQDSVFSIVKSTNLSPAVFSYLQPSENSENVPLGGILSDTNHGWLALGPKFCVVDLRTGLKVAARTFGVPFSNTNSTITSVTELPTPLTENSKQLIVCLECEDLTGLICVLHVNGSQILRCIQTDVVISEIAVCDAVPDGPLTSFEGIIMAGSKRGEIFAFDLNRASLIQALKDISQGYEHLVRTESNPANLVFMSLNALDQIEQHRDQALENDDHLALILNENSLVDGQYLFRNPDGSIRMKAKRDHIRVSSLQYIPQLGSLAVGYNFGAFQIWNMMSLELEFASQVNRECLPVTHFGFQEPCDDPRAFCYLWAVFSVLERLEEEEFPLAVMYSLTYQGKRMLSDTKCLYQEFLTATVRFQVELGVMENAGRFVGGRCVSCHTYSISSTLGEEGEDSMLNMCQLVWECWAENANSATEYGMLLFDLDQWYKDQMPSTYGLQSTAFMSASWCGALAAGGGGGGGGAGARALHVRLRPRSVAPYSHATRLEEHFYPNSVHYKCICLTTCGASVLSTTGIQRQIVSALDEAGPAALLNPPRLYRACVAAGLAPLYVDAFANPTLEEQRRFLLSVALEARLARFLKRCAHDWATGGHQGAGCTLPFLVDWCWQRALQLKENATELTAPLFSSSSLPDRNVVRCLEHCVQQLTQLTGLLDAILTKCCNLIVPDALSEIEEKFKAVGTVALYLQVVQWFLRGGLLPERRQHLPYPRRQLADTYAKRRLKLQRLHGGSEEAGRPCSLLYIDQLIQHEFGDRIQEMWVKGGSETSGLYPPPSLYALLRLYLLPDVAEEHKHSLVLYLLVDYSMVYEVRHEAVVRRLMQFPTMFGLSNTAIKATQAFWHLDHRDFDFALDQLQCLTGNTLSEWQHHVVLSSLLAQNMTQAALQYLHVRKPPPPPPPSPARHRHNNNRVIEEDKPEDWRSCCELYLARGLVHAALHVARTCAHHATTLHDKLHALNLFFKGCRTTGQLSKILQVTLLPFEEEAFVKYLEECNDPHTSDILIMYYLQQNRYLEAQQHNSRLRVGAGGGAGERGGARDALVRAACAALPAIAAKAASAALSDDYEHHIVVPKPMSVYVQARSPTNTFTYKSSFIQDTIENASETWVHRPQTRRGIKRALNIEDTPFICTPKLTRTRSIFSELESESTPPKRAKLEPSGAGGTPHTPHTPGTPRTHSAQLAEQVGRQVAALLHMPDVQGGAGRVSDRSGAGTPHSILKIRHSSLGRDAPSPADSRYLGDDAGDDAGDSDDGDGDELETASNHTHYSDSTNKHLRFTIPTASESGSTPSPLAAAAADVRERLQQPAMRQKEMDESMESFVTTTSTSHGMKDENPLESPPKKLPTEEKVLARKSYKDNVRARRSLSISANSSLSEDPNTSIESIADIPVTLINPRYRKRETETRNSESIEDRVLRYRETEMKDRGDGEGEKDSISPPRTPMGRRGIRSMGESTPLVNRSRSGTPERADSPTVTPLRLRRTTRSRSRTPSPRSLAPIPEQPRRERDSEPHTHNTTLSVPARLRSRSRTPERTEKMLESPRLAPISESPSKPEPAPEPEPEPEPPGRRLRSRSRSPQVDIETPKSPRTLRSRSKTPEKLMSPKADRASKAKKTLTRIVLEANTFAKTKLEKDPEPEENQSENDEKLQEKRELIECTPMKTLKQIASMDVSFSPIVNKSVLASDTPEKDVPSADSSKTNIGTLPTFTKINEMQFGKSILQSCESSDVETSQEKESDESIHVKLPAFAMNESMFGKSVLQSYDSSVAESSTHEVSITKEVTTEIIGEVKTITTTEVSTLACTSVLKDQSSLITNDSDSEEDMNKDWKERADGTARDIQKEKERIVEIEREIHEIEGDMSDGTSDEEIVEAEEDSEDETTEEDDESMSEAEDDIISIGDTSNSTYDIQLDEQTSSDSNNRLDIRISGDEQTSSDSNNRLEIHISGEEQTSSDSNNHLQIHIPGDELGHRQTEETEVVTVRKSAELGEMRLKETKDPLDQGQVSLLTDDNSGLSEQMELNYDDDEEEKQGEGTNAVIKIDVVVEEVNPTEEIKEEPATTSNSVDVVDARAGTKKPEPIKPEPIISETKVSTPKKNDKEQKTDKKEAGRVDSKPEKKDKQAKETESIKSLKQKPVEPPKDTKETEEQRLEKEKPASRLRKRATSTSSNKSLPKKDTDVDKEKTETEPEDGTPKRTTRKRAQSTTSNRSEEETLPKSRAKTPETRKILTRRASKEIEMGESPATPPRNTRSRNRTDDDVSVASGGSGQSARSRASDGGGSERRGRRSVVAARPELSAIPEVAGDDPRPEADVSEYSNSRRLTRHQKSMLSSLELRPRRAAFPVQPIDRISLLNKTDFEGPPDGAEPAPAPAPAPARAHADGEPDTASASASASHSEAPRSRAARRPRAASESKTIPKAAKIGRRVSVDVVSSPAESPSGTPRGGARRASFTRACEALLAPKGRRTSTDLKKQTESQPGSPLPAGSEPAPAPAPATPATPTRRGRRASTPATPATPATPSNTAAKEPAKRSKKLSTVEESDANK